MAVEVSCGIDVGTQGVRVVLVDGTGRIVGGGRTPLPAGERAAGRHEQAPDSWWAALTSATRAAITSAGEPVEVLAVALDATSGTILVEDAAGAARGPALMYDDLRAAHQATRAASVGAAQWASLGYRMQTSWALPRAMWLREHGAVGTGDRIVHQADHLVRRLVGAPVPTDTSTALKTGVDLRAVAWPESLLDELGVGGLFPPVALPGTPVGRIGASAAAETGLTAGATVRAGMTDGCAAQIASAALRTGRWSSALGTTLVIKGSTTDLVHDEAGAVYCHRHPDGGWLPGGASSSGAGVLAREFEGADLDALTRQATDLDIPGVTYPLSGRGERFPFVAPAAVGFVTAAAQSDAERFAAVCEGIAFVERLAYDTLAGLGADTSGAVSFTGGGARNRWWNQLRVDVLGRPAVLPASGEAAFGMAVLATAEPGRLTETAEALVTVTDELNPDADRHARLSLRYRGFVEELVRRGWLSDEVAGPVLDRVAVA